MKTTLYYLSGTGNSFKAARDLAARIGDTRIVPMGKAVQGDLDVSAERIGLLFPVIMFGIPPLVTRFIQKLNASFRGKYLFALITYGGKMGASLRQADRQLQARGLSLSRGFAVRMNRTKEDFDRWDAALDEIAAAIEAGETLPVPRVSFADGLLTYGVNTLARMMLPSLDKKFTVAESCDGCGICTRLCPAGNIAIRDEKPVWQHRCQQCFACLNWCPPKSIGYGKSTERYRYVNPHVTAKDLLEI